MRICGESLQNSIRTKVFQHTTAVLRVASSPAVGLFPLAEDQRIYVMETNSEVVCGSFTSEETWNNNLITLPAELLVYIMSLLVIHDRIKLRYVSRRLRRVSKVAALWSEFVWPYFERRHEYYVSDTLKACGEHVKQLMFPINMPSAKIVWLTEHCVNATQLQLPPRVYFHPAQLERSLCAMTHLEKLDVCWSEHIRPLLEICADLKELKIHIKKIKTEPRDWKLAEWASEGIRFPSVVRIFTKCGIHMMEESYAFLSKHYSVLPACEFYLYSSAKIPMNCHPHLPLLSFKFGPTASSPFVKASNYGILGFYDDILNVMEFNYDGKVMYGAMPSFYSGPHVAPLDRGFSTLSSITFFIAGYETIFPGHLEQIAIACPKLQWLDLYGCSDCLQSLKGLQAIVTMCQDLQGLNIADIPIMEVESYVLLWQVISRIVKLNHLTVGLCLLMVPDDVDSNMMVTIFQNCHSLQALEIQYGYCRECADWSIEDLLLSHFPSLTYCKLSYDNPNILHKIITTCKNLKYLCYDNRATVSLVPLNCSCMLQQLCIESSFTDIPDSFMDMISLHGGLEHMILSVRSITVNGIKTLISNSPKLMSFCGFIDQPLYNENGRKLQSKDFKTKMKKEFCHHKLFRAGCFRVSLGNQFFCQYDILTELNTDLNSLWSRFIY